MRLGWPTVAPAGQFEMAGERGSGDQQMAGRTEILRATRSRPERQDSIGSLLLERPEPRWLRDDACFGVKV